MILSDCHSKIVLLLFFPRSSVLSFFEINDEVLKSYVQLHLYHIKHILLANPWCFYIISFKVIFEVQSGQIPIISITLLNICSSINKLQSLSLGEDFLYKEKDGLFFSSSRLFCPENLFFY